MSHAPFSSDPETESLKTDGQLACPQYLPMEAGPGEKTHPWQQFFFGCPSHGGILSMVNMLLCLILYFLAGPIQPGSALEKVIFLGALLLSLPLFWFYLMFQSWSHWLGGVSEGIVTVIMFGTNAFAWGYGIAWLIQFARRHPSAYVLYGFCGGGLLYYYFRIVLR